MARRGVSDLKRRRPRREPKRRFFIFCEGAKTEPAYFAAIRRAHGNALIEIKTLGGSGVAFTLASAAADRARELKRARRGNSFEESDEVWAVFDHDEHPRLNEALDICRRARVGIGRSNPCFELWLILHEQDYDRPDDRHRVQAHLARLRPEYTVRRGKTPDCDDLVTRVEEAEQRAQVMLDRREAEGDRHDPPSTAVGSLTRAIREAARLSQP